MPSYLRRGNLGNVLVRKVHRHKEIATLYPGLGSELSSLPPGFEQRPSPFTGRGDFLTSAPLVQARLAKPDLDVPIADSAPFRGAAREPIRPAASGYPSPITPAAEKESVRVTSRPVLPREASAPVQPASPDAAPAPQADDSSWRRLQTIFRRHQDQSSAAPADSSKPAAQPAVPGEPAFRTGPGPSLPDRREETRTQELKSQGSPSSSAPVEARRSEDNRQPSMTAAEAIQRAEASSRPAAASAPRSSPGVSPAASPGPGINDSDWRRLQTIYRKHQEKEAPPGQDQAWQETSDDAQANEASRPVQNTVITRAAEEIISPSPAPVPVVQRLHNAPAQSPELANPSQQETLPARSQPAPLLQKISAFLRGRPAQDQVSDIQPRLEESKPSLQSGTPASTPGDTVQQPPQPLSGGAQPEEIPGISEVEDHSEAAAPGLTTGYKADTAGSSPKVPQIQLASRSLPSLADKDREERVPTQSGLKEASSGSIQAEPDRLAADEMIGLPESELEEETGALPEQALPLQAVWPIQRKDGVQPTPGEPPANTRLNLPDQQLPLEQTTGERHVQRMLESVQPGQPTDSHVEMIMPRRPRPEIQRSRLLTGGAAQSAPEDGMTGMLQTQPLVSEDPEAYTHRESLEMIQTPAGPLPASLLRQISEPSNQIEPASLPGSLMQGTGRSAPGIPLRPAVESPALQRTEKTSPPDAAPPGTHLQQMEGADGEQAETPEGSQQADGSESPDIDELARKVYAEVRRKLAVEWERMRR